MTFAEFQRRHRIRKAEAKIIATLDKMAKDYAKKDLRDIDKVYNRGQGQKLNTAHVKAKKPYQRPAGANGYSNGHAGVFVPGAAEVKSVLKIERAETRQVEYDRLMLERGEDMLRRYGKRRERIWLQ